MKSKDIISKQVIKNITADLANLLLQLNIAKEPIELLATEQQRIETRQADLVASNSQFGNSFNINVIHRY